LFEKNLVYLALLFYNAAQNAKKTFRILHLKEIIGTLSKEDSAVDELKKSLEVFISDYCLGGLDGSVQNSVKTIFQNSSYDFYLREVIIKNIKSNAQEGGKLDKLKIIYPIKINVGKYFIYTAFNHSSFEYIDKEAWDIVKVYFGIGNEKIRFPDTIATEYNLAGPESVANVIYNVNKKIINYLKNSKIKISHQIERELLPTSSYY
jgi:hypothetical protein